MTAYVFLGPTITRADALAEFDATYLPPVAQGDVIRVMARRPSAIGIVDGSFERVPAVWHKEILWALAEGVPVFGAGSMGALRAAELAAFGMEGVGTVFEQFRDGTLEDDDEVAVAHGDAAAGFRAMSEAMVVIRATLERAEREAIIGAADREALEAEAKRLHYPDRTWVRILPAAGDGAQRLRAWLPHGRVDCKRDDAVAMLRRMRAHAAEGSPSVCVRFEFEHTEWWSRALRTAGEPAADADEELVLDEARLDGTYPALRDAAVLAALSVEEARRARLRPDADQRRAAEADVTAARAHVSDRRFEELVDAQAAVRWVRRAFNAEIVRRGVDHLRATGDYSGLAARARRKDQTLEEAGLADAGVASTGLGREELRARLLPTNDREPAAIGFADADALERALVREHHYRRLSGEPAP